MWRSNIVRVLILLLLLAFIPRATAQDDSKSVFTNLEPISLDNVNRLKELMVFSVDRYVWEIDIVVDGNTYILAASSRYASPLHLWRFVGTDVKHTILESSSTNISGDFVDGFVFSPEGDVLAALYAYSFSGNDGVFIWDVETKQEVLSFSTGDDGWDIDISPDGKQIAVGFVGYRTCLWNMETAELQTCLQLDDDWPDPTTSIAYHPTAPILAAGNGSQGIRLWDLESNTSTRRRK